MISTFFDAGLNRLGDDGPTLPLIWKGYGAQAQQMTPYVPCILLEAMAYTESEGWKQFDAPHGECGFTKTGIDSTPTPQPTPTPDGPGTCGYGVMQITSGMGGGAGFDPNLVVADYRYGIGTGAKILIDKWNSRYSLGYRVGENDPRIVEDWYYAVWAYNGFAWKNNPNNEDLYLPQNLRGTWLCGTDPNQRRDDFPYQELIWGCAANPPGSDYWTASQLSFPSDIEVYTDDELPPPLLLNRPEPSHTSCSGDIYLPIIMKNWTTVYFFDTFNPINGGWTFYSSHSGRVADHVHVNTSTGHDDNRSLYITEQIDLYSYTSGARITLNVPPGISPLWLSFWYRRADPTYGGYEVRVDGQVEISHAGSSQSWQLETEEISSHATDGQITLDFRVPSKTGNSHDLLFDEIMLSTFQPSP